MCYSKDSVWGVLMKRFPWVDPLQGAPHKESIAESPGKNSLCGAPVRELYIKNLYLSPHVRIFHVEPWGLSHTKNSDVESPCKHS